MNANVTIANGKFGLKALKKPSKALEKRVGDIAQKAVAGYAIPMLSIPAIYQAGIAVGMDGGSDAEIEAAIKAKVLEVTAS